MDKLKYFSKIKNNSGFTLIELLVVVLIIGILAAVALPQYQVTVAKSRFAEFVLLGKAITDAQQRVKLETGAYTNDVGSLDIDVPPGGTNTPEGDWSYTNYPNGLKIGIFSTVNPHAVCIAKTGYLLTYCSYFTGDNRQCRGEASNGRVAKVCKSLGGTFSMKSGDVDFYVLP